MTMNDDSASGAFDSYWRGLREVWNDLAVRPSLSRGRRPRASLPESDADRVAARMEACLEERGGEVSARARAAELGRVYLDLNTDGRGKFLHLLASRFGVDRKAIDNAIADLQAAGDDLRRYRAAKRILADALVPPRGRLLAQFTTLPQGMKFLVDMRRDMLALAREDAAIGEMAEDLRGMLANWFDIGLLDLKPITWDSPASLLEKLILYEAVHAVESWADLRNRLASDRRCYAYFHPRMPDEPLIFVQVALVQKLADNVQALLDVEGKTLDPMKADTAIFYSISNTQEGLTGISFGNFLIKRVVDGLARELPNLKTFATLSPIPGFLPWLRRTLAAGTIGSFSADEHRALKQVTGHGGAKGAFKALLDRPDWHADPTCVEAAKAPLMRLCARYLLQEKARDGRPLDPVARFHLHNGARVERLNWLADTSPRGLSRSAGLMVNYLYRLGDIEDNHEAFASRGTIASASEVRSLARKGAPATQAAE